MDKKLKTLDNYFNIITQTGYVNQQELFNVIGYLFLDSVTDIPYAVLTPYQLDCILYAMDRIAAVTCLIPNSCCL